MFNKSALIEAVKELLRVVLLSVIPVIIFGLENNGTLDVRTVLLTGAIAAFRFLDKYIHELGKENENVFLTKGITRF